MRPLASRDQTPQAPKNGFSAPLNTNEVDAVQDAGTLTMTRMFRTVGATPTGAPLHTHTHTYKLHCTLWTSVHGRPGEPGRPSPRSVAASRHLHAPWPPRTTLCVRPTRVRSRTSGPLTHSPGPGLGWRPRVAAGGTWGGRAVRRSGGHGGWDDGGGGEAALQSRLALGRRLLLCGCSRRTSRLRRDNTARAQADTQTA